MIPMQMTKGAVLITPQSVATTATATGRVDTLGAEYCTIDAILDSAAATSSNPATLKLSEGTTTVYTNATAIAAFTGDDTTDGFTIPNADTAAAQIVRFHVDLRKRERYLWCVITPAGAAQIVAAVANLSRMHEAPNTDAEAGCAEIVYG